MPLPFEISSLSLSQAPLGSPHTHARCGLAMAKEQASFFTVIVTGQVEFADVRFFHPRAASNPTRAFPSRRAFAFVPIGKWTSPPLAKHHEHHYSNAYSDPTNRPTCSKSSPVHPTDSRLRQRVLQVRGGARRRLDAFGRPTRWDFANHAENERRRGSEAGVELPPGGDV